MKNKQSDQLQLKVDTAWLYQKLADIQEDASTAEVLRSLSGIENNHVQHILSLIRESVPEYPLPPPSSRAKWQFRLGGIFGYDFIIANLSSLERQLAKTAIEKKRQTGEKANGFEHNHLRILESLSQSSNSNVSGSFLSKMEGSSAIAYDGVNGRVVVVGVMRSSPTLFENIPYPGNPTCYDRSNVLPDPPFVAFFSVVDGIVPFLSRTLGVSFWDDDVDVAVDELGNTFVAGSGMLYDYNPELNSNPSGAYVQTNVVEEDMFWLSSACVMRLDGEANLTWFTPLGGPANEFGAYLAVDDANDFLYLAGSTQSRNYATKSS